MCKAHDPPKKTRGINHVERRCLEYLASVDPRAQAHAAPEADYIRYLDHPRRTGHRPAVSVREGCKGALFDAMYTYQGGACAICGCTPGRSVNGGRGLQIDHCHVTGEVRALLCHNCNVALARVREDPNIIDALKRYALLCQDLISGNTRK